jgi:hypothetical protein
MMYGKVEALRSGLEPEAESELRGVVKRTLNHGEHGYRLESVCMNLE